MGACSRIVQLSVSEGSVPKRAVPENVTIEGWNGTLAVPDVHLLRGLHVRMQVTRYTIPCATIAPMFRGGGYSRVSQKRHPGWSRVYARALTEGEVRTGDAVRLVSAAEARQVFGASPIPAV